MTRLFQNKLRLEVNVENVLPQLGPLIATTSEGEALLEIGGMVFDPRIQAVAERQKPGASNDEFQAWWAEYEAARDSAAWVSFTMSPAAALELARTITALVGPDGAIKEPRSIGVLSPDQGPPMPST